MLRAEGGAGHPRGVGREGGEERERDDGTIGTGPPRPLIHLLSGNHRTLHPRGECQHTGFCISQVIIYMYM